MDHTHMLGFKDYLYQKGSSDNTIAKYLRDVKHFLSNVDEISYESLRDYREDLIDQYAPSSVNSMIAALNQYLIFLDMETYKVKPVRIQKEVFSKPETELDKGEYRKLVAVASANGDGRLALVMEAICGTGIRVSELEYFTIEAVKSGQIRVHNKGKIRVIMIPHKLKMKLLYYAKKCSIHSGCIFITKWGNPLDRSNLWSMMKKLAAQAGVSAGKIFPHNLRHLFARTYYSFTKDISKLADLLGHSSINTTRIYTISSGVEHQQQIEQLGLVL
ncbi:MAG: tyrosine-type recombinase/integrase [Lachnospiraceae bacterium]